ncbi:class I SAM-dependent methyltransferase [Micromonospora sp. LOL_021]|uniref:class I SAM-dependent methyltransferase n=1 Tax=Micromonospora sp. LOL_021 TaxID=3345417 RepID=UPI003A87C740
MDQTREDDVAVRQFYETYGWQRGSSGQFRDAEAFVDLRPVMDGYHRRRDQRVARLLAGEGPLLDLGCGGAPVPVAADGGLRVNLDFAAAALRGARQTLGDAASYLQADICQLPFPAATFGRVLCAHVLYHLTPERQTLALTEICRVLRPGGVAVLVYIQTFARLQKLARRLRLDSRPVADLPPLPYHPVDHRRLQVGLRDRARIEVRSWSILAPEITRTVVPGGRAGRAMVAGVAAVEDRLPRWSARLARYPMLVVRKSRSHDDPPTHGNRPATPLRPEGGQAL